LPIKKTIDTQESVVPMRRTEMELVADDATTLYVRHTAAASNSARSVILIHGLCEHGARYEHIVSVLAEHGWNVIVPDLRGHGLSGGVNTHVGRFLRYTADLDLIYAHFGLAPQTTALIAHSMGGLVSLRFAQQFPGRLSAMTLISPLLAVKVPIPRRTIATGKIMSLVAPRTRFRTRVDPMYTTHSPEALERRATDPLIHKSVTAGWYFAMRAALAAAWEEAGKVDLPLQILQAGDDRMVDAEAPAQWLKLTKSADVTLQTFADHYHELLNELDWQEILASVIAWLDTRVATRSSQQQTA
jgi:lysophospholipase